MSLSLSPTQQRTYDWLTLALSRGNLLLLRGEDGRGRTTVLRKLHQEFGGVFLSMREYMRSLSRSDPRAMEEVFEHLLLDALATHETVILDDLHLLVGVLADCGMSFYPRKDLIQAVLTTVAAAAEGGKRLVVGANDRCPHALVRRAYSGEIGEFTPEDYAFFGQSYLGPAAEGLDYAQIHRFAPKLGAHQLRNACVWLRGQEPTTEEFIDYLRSQQMASNVDLGEVQAVDLHDLKGVEDVIRSLEANIILPLEMDELAAEFDIRPKRGVLLAGPPGTGKTTVGRALAHRLKSKFFMIDGTFISGSRDFYERVHRVFEAAKQNAPAVIFIDDSDVIFENHEEAGLYRYLLTALDGLESESAGRVCVMMTAMDVGNLPPALVRSGRIELWLETRLPDAEAREAILGKHMEGLPASMREVDAAAVAEAAEGLTGADLKRLVEDGKILFAYDVSTGTPRRPATEYFLSAIQTVRANKERYAAAEALARQRHPSRPSFFNMFDMEE